MPDKLSVPLKLIVTFVLFQPLTLGQASGCGGGRRPCIDGYQQCLWGFLVARFIRREISDGRGSFSGNADDPEAPDTTPPPVCAP